MTYEEILKKLALADDRFIVMTAENRAPVRNLPAALGNRFIDTGITEQAMIGAAAGLALRGRIVVTHALATFLTLRAFEFIRTDVGIANLPVKLVGWVPGFLSDGNGPTHQAIEDVGILRGIPNMKIFAPADYEDLVAGIEDVLTCPSPCYVRFNTRKAVTPHAAPFAMGKAEVFGDEKKPDVALLTYGTLFTECWEAKAQLEKNGCSVRLVNLRTLVPLDEAAVEEALSSAKLAVTVEDHFLKNGLYSMVAEVALTHRLAPNVMPIALENRWYRPGRFSEVLKHEGFTGSQLAQKISARFSRV